MIAATAIATKSCVTGTVPAAAVACFIMKRRMRWLASSKRFAS